MDNGNISHYEKRRRGLDWKQAGLVENVSGGNAIENVRVPRKKEDVYAKANMTKVEDYSTSKNVHETLSKLGLDNLIELAESGKNVGDNVEKLLGKVYLTGAKYTWHSDYQSQAMEALGKYNVEDVDEIQRLSTGDRKITRKQMRKEMDK